MKINEAAWRRIKGRMPARAITRGSVFARSLTVVAVAAAVGSGSLAATSAPSRQSAAYHLTGSYGAAPPGAAAPGKPDYRRACPVAPPGQMACMALIRTDLPPRLQPPAAQAPADRLQLRAGGPAERL